MRWAGAACALAVGSVWLVSPPLPALLRTLPIPDHSVPCALCHGTRAILAIQRGDWPAAVQENAFVTTVMVAAIVAACFVVLPLGLPTLRPVAAAAGRATVANGRFVAGGFGFLYVWQWLFNAFGR